MRYGPQPPVLTKLDPYTELIRTHLDRYPERSAVRLLDEIRATGYTGGYTQLQEYVRAVRPRPEWARCQVSIFPAASEPIRIVS